ncbi:BapA/Bap/LapF family prefix-like domain-containing protein, partial [Pseudomonas zeae]|uniref:BapA/Bap/LapF family prefix-like domain-containing protein n=1 Tax=Pseudomonas zeae TaxID=2745510 RepID=UPI0039E07ADC
MKTTVVTVVNKNTHASSTVSGLHAALAEPSVVQLSVDSIKDIASLQRQGNALLITLRSGEVITVDDFYLLHKGVKNTLVIQDAHGELMTPAMDAAGQPILDTTGFVKLESIEPLLLDGASEFNGWWLAGAGLVAGGIALASGGGGGGGGSDATASVTDQAPTARAVISIISSDTNLVGDFVTSDRTLMVTAELIGTLASGEKVQISVDGGATWHDAQLLGGNLYAYDNTGVELTDGSYTFVTRVISAGGTPSVVSTQVVVIDTVTPDVASQTVAITRISDDTGLSDSDFVTTDKTLTVSGSLGVTLAAGESVEVSVDGGATWVKASVSGTAWSVDLGGTPLVEGSYTLQTRVVDVAGNVGAVASQSLQIDATAQVALINFTSISPDTGIN